MALLNYALTYEEVSGFLDKNPNQDGSLGDYGKLIFTGDGHIITHGVDYTPLFNQSKHGKGLVTSPAADAPLSLLTSNNNWVKIETNLGTENNPVNINNIPNIDYVHKYMNTQLSAVDVMRFKGTIEYNDKEQKYYTNDVEGFPTECEVGDTYRIGTDGNYAEKKGEPGDLLICRADGKIAGTVNSLNKGTYWTVIQTNIDGKSELKINGSTGIVFYGTGPVNGGIYAPIESGRVGQVLYATAGNGSSVPVWGDLPLVTKTISGMVPKILDSGTAASTGNLILVGNTSGDGSAEWRQLPVGVDTWRGIKVNGIEVFGTSATAANVLEFINHINDENDTIADSAFVVSEDKKISLQVQYPYASPYISEDSKGNGGLMSAEDKAKLNALSLDNYREILVNEQSIDKKDENGAITKRRSLNIMPSEEIHVIVDDTKTDDVYEIGFGLMWYNISANSGNGAYEYV